MNDDLLIIDSVIPSTSTSSQHAATANRNGSTGSDFGEGEASKRNSKFSSLTKMNSGIWGGDVLDDSTVATTAGGNPNMKNAGRKKTNPAWEFFIDMREKGMTGVCCRHCDFYSEDRSPTLLKFHVKRFHDTGPGGLWHQLKEKYDWSVPHKYNAKKKNSAETDGSYADKVLEKPGKMLFNNYINDIGKLENGCGLMMNLLLLSSQQAQKQQLMAYDQQQQQQLNVVGGCRGSEGGSPASPLNNGTRSATVTPFSDAPSMLSDGSEGGSRLEKPKEEATELDTLFPVVPCDWSRLLPNVEAPLFRKEEMVNRAVDLSKQKRPRNANVWQYMGTFDSEDEMHKVRIREKVSKRRTEQLRNGIKVRYRCNKWKRTKCAYQMFALFANDKIDLYETGVHDHSGDRMQQHALKMQNKGAVALSSAQRKRLKGKNGATLPTAFSDTASETRKELLRNLMMAQPKNGGNAEIVTVAPFGVNYSAPLAEDLTSQNVENLLNACCQYIKEECLSNADSGAKSDEPVTKRFCLGSNAEGNGGAMMEGVYESDSVKLPTQRACSPPLNPSDVGLSSAVALAAAASAGFGNMSSMMEFLVGFNNAYTQLMKASATSVAESNGRDESGKYCDETLEDVEATCTAVDAKHPDAEEEPLIVVDDNEETVVEVSSAAPLKEAESTPATAPDGTFSLMDTQRLAELVEIATKLKLTLAFTNKDGACKYIFYPKEADDSPTKGRRSVALSEEGADGQTLCIEDLLAVDDDDKAPTVVRTERWRKSDWSQFLWAIRGKCVQYFRASTEEPTV